MAKKAKKLKEKKIKIKKTNFFYLYIIGGALAIIVGLMFAPLWESINNTYDINIPWASWYIYAFGIMLASAIFVYVFTVLLKTIKNKDQNKTVRIIMIFEFTLMIMLALLSLLHSILHNNEDFKWLNACEIVGLILYIRGVVEMIDAYYYDKKTNRKYTIGYLIFNILLITIAPLIFYKGVKSGQQFDKVVSYIFCALIVFGGVFLCVFGGLSKPIKVEEIPADEKPQEIENKKEEVVKEEKEEKNKKDEVIDI